jgi:hypothetical protein
MIAMKGSRHLLRLHRDEEGFALVIAILLVSIMMVLMVVALNAGQSSLHQSQENIRWTRTLAIAEAGINEAITTLGQNRAATPSCRIESETACPAEGGEYQVDWQRQPDGSIEIRARGYYPSLAAARHTREVRVVLEPVPVFRYALFSQDALTVKNDSPNAPPIVGDIYSALGVEVGQNQVICGSVVAAGGPITLGNNSQVVKSHTTSGCTGKSGLVWANGPIEVRNGVVIQGDAKASAPSGTSCSTTHPDYKIFGGGSVQGNATACGQIASTVRVSGISQPGVSTTPPAVEGLPTFVFDPNNYPSLTCYPSSGTCGVNTSPTAVSSFNTYVAGNKTNMRGTFAIWQSPPISARDPNTTVKLENITLSGDLTVITNAPVDFGNTTTITTAPGVTSATLVVISLYEPDKGTTCDTNNGGECSIYSKNKVLFDAQDPSNPDDGVAVLLYSKGPMAVKNQGTTDGALYAKAMDIKNGFTIEYNSRIERILGFGEALEVTLWQEINA